MIAKKNAPTVIYGTNVENNIGKKPMAMTITFREIALPVPSKISWNDSSKFSVRLWITRRRCIK